jgi:hypothetical protein
MHPKTTGTLARAVAALALLGASFAHADCPTACVPGGGPAATDCFVQFSGVPGPTTANVSCTDGDTACDTDGRADGACTVGLQVCVGAASASCAATPLASAPTVTPSTAPGAPALAAALGQLDLATGGCTPPGVTVPLKLSVGGIKPGRTRFAILASAGTKRDRDLVKLSCKASLAGPSFANDVQPILTARCATPTCHAGPTPSGGQNLEAGKAYAQSVNAPALAAPTLKRVKPGNPRQSFLVRKLFGTGGVPAMPQGCPGVPPAGGCLTPGEIYTIIAWVKAGALEN